MAAPVPGPGSSEHGGMIPAAWPAQAADTIVDTISKVRDKTTKPAIVAARALVYGVLVAVAGTIALVLLLIIGIRLLSLLPGDIWTVYLGLGVLFSGGGLFLLGKANKPTAAA